MNLNVSRSYGTQLVYGTVYPSDVIGFGFNTRWGGYYVSLSGDDALGVEA